jgi:putative spermidine/putrescine transport system substrate-binding protein
MSTKLNRAAILAAVAALCALTAPALAQESLAVASYGGAYQEALRKAFYTPTEKKLGIVIKDSTLVSIADVRTQVKAGAVQWDVVELYSGQCQQAANEGLIEPLDYKVIANTAGVPKDLIKDYWVGFTAYSTVLAWNTKVYKDPPKTWADFWDTKKFPGTRSLGGYGLSTNAEIALLADGVSIEKMYPIDQDRALKKLTDIRPAMTAWWMSGAQAAQLAQSEEADMLSIWVARIDAAIKQGAPYDYTYNQAVMDIECLVVPKGSPRKELAMKAINSFLDPQLQADLMNYVPYGPVNQDAYKTGKISKELMERANTAPDNFKKQVVQNKEYWAEAGQKSQERWDAFMQKK